MKYVLISRQASRANRKEQEENKLTSMIFDIDALLGDCEIVRGNKSKFIWKGNKFDTNFVKKIQSIINSVFKVKFETFKEPNALHVFGNMYDKINVSLDITIKDGKYQKYILSILL